MNDAHKSLLARLRKLVREIPKSGAVDAKSEPLSVSRLSRAIEERADAGPALVDYVLSKVHEPPTDAHNALIKAGRPDLTIEALAAEADKPWSSAFTDEDRTIARARVGAMLAAHDGRSRLVRRVGKLLRRARSRTVRWFDDGDTTFWAWSLVAVLFDFVVVRGFVIAVPAPPPAPELPLGGATGPSGVPAFPLVPFAVLGACLAAIYVWVAFTRRGWIRRASHLILVLIWLVFSFSYIYYTQGNEEQALGLPAYPNFGHALSKSEALYFTMGTLTTAGTGDLHPNSRDARTAVIVQMSLGVLVLVIGIAGVVRGPGPQVSEKQSETPTAETAA